MPRYDLPNVCVVVEKITTEAVVLNSFPEEGVPLETDISIHYDGRRGLS